MKNIIACFMMLTSLSLISGCDNYSYSTDMQDASNVAIQGLESTWGEPVKIVWRDPQGSDEVFVYFKGAYFDIWEGHIEKSIIYNQKSK